MKVLISCLSCRMQKLYSQFLILADAARIILQWSILLCPNRRISEIHNTSIELYYHFQFKVVSRHQSLVCIKPWSRGYTHICTLSYGTEVSYRIPPSNNSSNRISERPSTQQMCKIFFQQNNDLNTNLIVTLASLVFVYKKR